MIDLATTRSEMMSFFEAMSLEELELRLAAVDTDVPEDNEEELITVSEPDWLHVESLTELPLLSGEPERATKVVFNTLQSGHWTLGISGAIAYLGTVPKVNCCPDPANSSELALAA